MQNVEVIKVYQKTSGSNKTACLFKTTYPWNNKTIFWAGLIPGGKEIAKFSGIETIKWYCNNGPIARWIVQNNWTANKKEELIDLVAIYDKGLLAQIMVTSNIHESLSHEEDLKLINKKLKKDQNYFNKSEILVSRFGTNDYGLWGYIYEYVISGYVLIGYTLEPRLNIPIKGYIPEGIYDFSRWESQTLGKTLRLHNVPNFTNVLVHVGNWERQTLGCILAGKKIDNSTNPSMLQNSRALTDYLFDNYENGKITVRWL